jgi:hypothetical protein
MGSPGHAFIAHTKALSPRAQAKDGGYGPPPHPHAVRPGQRYWPRSARRRDVVTVKRVDFEQVVMGRPGGHGGPPIRITVARLLAVRADGQGRHYQFQGFVPRRYVTYAYVLSVADSEAVLCLPEWHPARAVCLLPRLLPDDGRVAGAWLRLRCDLSASSAGRLQPADLVTSAAPEPGFPAPAWDGLADHK